MEYESTAAGEEKISGCKVNELGVSSQQKIRNVKVKFPTKNAVKNNFKKNLLVNNPLVKIQIDT